MATYLVSARLEWGDNYTTRWASVIDAIRLQASGRTWEELTSLIVFQSTKSPEDIATSVYVNSHFSVATDSLLVVNAETCTYATRGQIKDPGTLSDLFARGALLNALRGFGS